MADLRAHPILTPPTNRGNVAPPPASYRVFGTGFPGQVVVGINAETGELKFAYPVGGGGGASNTDQLPEGVTNLYSTVSRIRNAISASGPLSWNQSTGVLSFSGALFSGNYADLSGKPTLFSGAYADLIGKPALSTVATSGSYADLLNRPALFSGAYADLTGKPALAAVATSGAYADLAGKPALRYDINTFCTGKPAASEVLLDLPALVAISFAANLAASLAIATTGAAASAVWSLTKNGTQVATVTFAAGANAATFSGAAFSLAVGDRLRLIAPTTQDSALADLTFAFAGTR